MLEYCVLLLELRDFFYNSQIVNTDEFKFQKSKLN